MNELVFINLSYTNSQKSTNIENVVNHFKETTYIFKLYCRPSTTERPLQT